VRPTKPEVRRLLALAAALAPGRAVALVGRRAGEVGELRQEAARLAAAPRRDRLAALAQEMTILAEGAQRAPPGRLSASMPPLLARLRDEARWRAAGSAKADRDWSAGRTAVRPAAGVGAACARDPAPLALARRVD